MSHNGSQQAGRNPEKSGIQRRSVTAYAAPADSTQKNDVNGLAILVLRDSKLST
jgi:hypothetical protein